MNQGTAKALSAAALLALLAGCGGFDPGPQPNVSAEENCRQEGFDPGTTEYDDCVKQLSDGD